ncbi:MAG: hypothetical protein RIS43_784 [Actinomycetota bacterium]|jgi:transporter family-2 protein
MTSHTHERHYFAQFLAIVVGALTTLQSRVNGELSFRLQNGIEAAAVSFSTGLILLSLYALFSRQTRQGFRNLSSALKSKQIFWWQCIGGSVGAMFVAIQSVSVPLVGVAIFTIATVGGQIASSLVVDRMGLGPQGRIHPSRNRILAAIVAVAAVAVSVSHRIEGSDFPLIAVIAALGVGAGVSVQHSFNGHVNIKAGSPVTAALMNFIVGTTVLYVIFGIGIASGHYVFEPLPAGPFYLYLGGLFGLLFIITASRVIKLLGSLRFAMGSVTGQLVGSLLLDIFVPTSGSDVSIQLLSAIAMTALAVVLANLRPKSNAI